ncbi:MAG: helix-turn-helix domain-containing protein [Faecalibacterium sp.]|nr:helix-turn-helix domain-containing protein [Ruminococcus sp.]MCM1392475.1 helix-turn-helix domain-containing protein [Ruminococcus sp.]MCM1486208.1 helix-turn-helix domain-containing protein [Faecalibacterium sp.]
MTIYEKIKYLREELGMSQQELANKVGFKTASAVNKIELGLRDINQSRVKAFAAALGTSTAYLMDSEESGETKSHPLPSNIIPLPTTKLVPLVGTIACGKPILAEENIEDYVKADESIPADFALRCKGDSMINSRIYDGDIVYIRKQSDVDDGEIAAVLIGDEATLKKVYKYPNKIVLRASNPIYDDMIYTDAELENIIILGKAVAFLSLVR